MAVLAVIDDLLFRVKIEAAASRLGVPLRVAGDATGIRTALAEASWSPVIIDLNSSGFDVIEAVRAVRHAAPSAVIIGYASHTQASLRRAAQEAGCALVLPRSALVQRLPALLLGSADGSMPP